MKTLKQFKNKQMTDHDFAEEYQALQPELDVIKAIIEARTSQNLTQKQLAERTGIKIEIITVGSQTQPVDVVGDLRYPGMGCRGEKISV